MDRAGEGAYLPLLLGRLDSLREYEATRPEPGLRRALHSLATTLSDSAERSAFAHRLVALVEGERAPAPADMDLIRSLAASEAPAHLRARERDAKYLECLQLGHRDAAASLAKERAAATQDHALRQAWLTRSLLLLLAHEAPSSVIAPLARELAQDALSSGDSQQPTLYRFALEVEAAAMCDQGASPASAPSSSSPPTPHLHPDLRKVLAIQDAARSGIAARFQSVLATWLPAPALGPLLPRREPAQPPDAISTQFERVAREFGAMPRAEQRAFDAATALLDEKAWRDAASAFLDLAADITPSPLQEQLLRLAGAAAALDGDEALALACLDLLPERLNAPASLDMIRLLLKHGRLGRAAALLPDMRETLPAPARETLLQAAAATERASDACVFLLRALSDHPRDEAVPPQRMMEAAILGPQTTGAQGRVRELVAAILPLWARDPEQSVVLQEALRVSIGLLGETSPLLTWLREMSLGEEARALLLDAFEEHGLLADFVENVRGLPTAAPPLLMVAAEAAACRMTTPQHAEEMLDRLLALQPAWVDAAMLRATLLMASEEYEAACSLLESTSRLVEDADARSALYLQTGRIYEEKLGRGSLALEQYMIAFICRPSNTSAFEALSRLYRAARRHRDLSGIYEIALEEARIGGAAPLPLEDLLLQAAQVRLEKLADHAGAAELLAELIEADPGETFYVSLLLDHVLPNVNASTRVREALRLHMEAVSRDAADPRVAEAIGPGIDP